MFYYKVTPQSGYHTHKYMEITEDDFAMASISPDDVDAYITSDNELGENGETVCLTIDAKGFPENPTKDLAAIRGALYVADALDAEVILTAMYALKECPELSVEQAIAIGISNWIK